MTRLSKIIGYCKCEICGSEAKVDMSKILASYPPMYEYTCENENCKHHGYILTSEVVEYECPTLTEKENHQSDSSQEVPDQQMTDLQGNSLASGSTASNTATIKGSQVPATNDLYDLHDLCDCTSCIHEAVCRFKEEYKKKSSEISLEPDTFMKVKVECRYYANLQNLQFGTSLLRKDATDSDLYDSTFKRLLDNPCLTCDFTKKLSKDKVFIGDSPCQWCSSNPYKLTFVSDSTNPYTPTYVSDSTKTADNKTVNSKTILNENIPHATTVIS